VSDELWAKVQPLLPPRVNPHRFGGGRPPAADRLPDQGAAGGGGCGPNPTDRAKQGTKRSLLVEVAGVPVAVVVAGANQQ